MTTTRPFRSLAANARAVVVTEPLWALFGTSALYYITLFMADVGLSNVQIGLVISINLYFRCFLQFLAAPITNKLGRKRATFLFDVSAWVIPMFIWALSGNFWFFLIGYILNSTTSIVNVSFWLLSTEDSPEEERPRVIAALKLVNILAGFLVPIAGLFAARYGELPTFRVLFLLGAAAMLAQNLIRNALSTETGAGQQARTEHADTTYFRGAIRSLRVVGAALHVPRIRGLIVLYVATFLAFQINVFQTIYTARTLHFSPFVIGLVPAVSAAATLAVFLFLMPRMAKRASMGQLTFEASIIVCLGWGLFLFIRDGDIPLLLVATTLFGVGTFCLESYRDALVISAVPDKDRADLFAAVQTITSILAIPSGLIAAVIFDANPLALFLVITALYALGLIIASGHNIRNQTGVATPTP
ncbi:MFS transporter [Agreia pratensis]|uniref:MFS transporter n=1 Tax=Agreia pratensis TaxID=150121 RepID=UPI00188C36D8|nr:MFS transporter [Agreia pratensis]MBF4635794.1 MFS transporter [Agreia pratensis]